jgi:hypothetical protein
VEDPAEPIELSGHQDNKKEDDKVLNVQVLTKAQMID